MSCLCLLFCQGFFLVIILKIPESAERDSSIVQSMYKLEKVTELL